ncbi:MAG: hypothetical protein AAB932_02500 [Patescibacteria group bacterium]
MMTIVKATSKGQITLPAAWRRRFRTDRFFVEDKGGLLAIAPFDLKKAKQEEEEYTVFDALRDNRGKGIRAKDLIGILKKMKPTSCLPYGSD